MNGNGTLDVINILDMIDANGEDTLIKALLSFECPINRKIESFFKNNAIDFAKRHISITYLVLDADDKELLGYFTLTHKPLLICYFCKIE